MELASEGGGRKQTASEVRNDKLQQGNGNREGAETASVGEEEASLGVVGQQRALRRCVREAEAVH